MSKEKISDRFRDALDNGTLVIVVDPKIEGVSLAATEQEKYTQIDITARNATPTNLASLHYPLITPDKGLVLNGRAPGWIYSNLTAYYRDKCLWIGVVYPNVKGAVITVSRIPTVYIGEVVRIKNV